MDNTYLDPHMENDNTERIRGKRLSSILKAPRSPLHDLGSGNEFTQDINVERRRKNSRRVSFADTINFRVFQRDHKTEVAEKENTDLECAADTRKQVLLNQNEEQEPEAVECEITGMDTLLHAPIQALVQQAEWYNADNTIQRTTRHDTTVIFSDENEMDMTAPHTAVITHGLENNQTDTTENIPAFLAGLKSNDGKSETNKEIHFFCDPSNNSCPSSEEKADVMTGKKLNFDAFLMSLKSHKKVLTSVEGPEKENLFFGPSQVSEDMAQSSAGYLSSQEPETTCNVTKIFSGQDDGMEVTKCQPSDVKTVFPGTYEAPPEQLVCADVTEAFADDGMDMTINYTAKLSFPFSNIENLSLNFKKDFPATELDNSSILKRTPTLQLPIQENPQLCTDKAMVNAENRLDTTVLQAIDQQPQTMSVIPGSISFDTVFQCDKTVAFSTGDDMEITGNYTGVINNESTKGLGSLCSKAMEKTANTKSLPAEHSHPACDDDRGITKNLADKIIPKVLCDDKPNLDKEAGQEVLSNSRASVFVMDHMENTETYNGALQKNSVQGRQHDQSIPLTSIDKTIMFTGKQNDMEMTVDNSIERILSQDRLKLAKQVGKEAVLNGKTVIFVFPEDMEITKTHTAILSGEMDLQDRPSISSLPADKTIVFTDNQEDMEITAPHSVALSNEVKESKELSCKSTRQPSSQSVSSASCSEGTYSPCARDPTDEYPAESKDKPDHSASSAFLFPSEKETFRGHSDAIADAVYMVSLPGDISDVCTPHSPTGNSVSVNNQDLGKLKSRRVSVKLSGNVVMDFNEGGEDLVSHVSLPIQQLDCLKNVPEMLSTQGNQVLKDDSSRQEDLTADLVTDGSRIVPVSNNKSNENDVFSPEGEKLPEDFQMNSEQTGQLSVSDIAGNQTDPTLVPKLTDILNICSKLENIRRRSAVVSVSEVTSVDPFPKSPAPSEETLNTGKNTAEEENVCLESGAAPIQANLDMALKDKYQGINVPLGIFLPKLPSRRNPSISSEKDINVKSSNKIEAVVSEVSPGAAESPDGNNCSGQNLNLSHFIAEEFLPVFLEEMDSHESVNSEPEGDSNEMNKRETPYNQRTQSEKAKASNSPKRALEHDEKLSQLKKLKMDESLDGEASQDLQVISAAVSKSQIEIHEDEDSPAKSPECTQANTSSSLDSVKADTELTTQRSSQMESQLFIDSICEDNLWEKFQSGVITVGEFFTLLQVHIPIQKPRQSHLPANYTASTPPTAEDLLYSQYMYQPTLRIYEEDCQVLSQMIDELKPYASVQNQLLVNVNRSLWEVMRTCSDEELKSFGAELNKMKSCFTKESKILAHNGKVTLYSKLLQSAQEQWEKLQTRITKMDEILTEAESCLAALEGDSGWDEFEAECDEKAGCEPKGRKIDEELENLRAQEEELQRELSDLETEKEQVLAEINQLQKKEKGCEELLNTYNNFNEWEISEWSDQQAVFTFLYDSIEFTVVFGSQIDGDFFGGIPCRKIVSMSFESLLDEEEAPLSSRLVQRLIFQFIESKGCWQERCPTLHYLPQVLHDISLVVSRCKVLGEEIEFLEKWGGKFNLLKTDINDTEVKLLFSSSTAFAKFTLTLSLSANYPSASLPFTAQTKIGNIGEEEISAVLSKVPTGYHYLRRMVSSIHQNLLQGPR